MSLTKETLLTCINGPYTLMFYQGNLGNTDVQDSDAILLNGVHLLPA